MSLSTLLLVTALVVVGPHRADGIACSDVYTSLLPCLGYIQGSGGAVPSSCCSGLQSVVAGATSKLDRQTACSCIEKAAADGGVGDKEWALAGGLPDKCGVNVPFKISPSTDCSNVN